MPGSGGASASTYTSMMRVTTKGRPFAKVHTNSLL